MTVLVNAIQQPHVPFIKQSRIVTSNPEARLNIIILQGQRVGDSIILDST